MSGETAFIVMVIEYGPFFLEEKVSKKPAEFIKFMNQCREFVPDPGKVRQSKHKGKR